MNIGTNFSFPLLQLRLIKPVPPIDDPKVSFNIFQLHIGISAVIDRTELFKIAHLIYFHRIQIAVEFQNTVERIRDVRTFQMACFGSVLCGTDLHQGNDSSSMGDIGIGMPALSINVSVCAPTQHAEPKYRNNVPFG